jgi:hypothetical protein
MLAPSTLPDWLPLVVADEAQRIFYTDIDADTELVLRLATDKSMKPVWDELRKEIYKVASRSQLESCVSHAVAPREVPLSGLTDREAALTLFFWYAYAFAFMNPAVGIVSPRDLPIADCRLQAARLRLSAVRLRGLYLIPTPARNFLPADITEQFADIYANNIEEAAKFLDEIEAALVKLKAAEAPLVVSKDYGNREARGYVRVLAAETRKLFGTTLIRTLATTASVALSTKVTPTQVRKWTQRKRTKRKPAKARR